MNCYALWFNRDDSSDSDEVFIPEILTHIKLAALRFFAEGGYQHGTG